MEIHARTHTHTHTRSLFFVTHTLLWLAVAHCESNYKSPILRKWTRLLTPSLFLLLHYFLISSLSLTSSASPLMVFPVGPKVWNSLTRSRRDICPLSHQWTVVDKSRQRKGHQMKVRVCFYLFSSVLLSLFFPFTAKYNHTNNCEFYMHSLVASTSSAVFCNIATMEPHNFSITLLWAVSPFASSLHPTHLFISHLVTSDELFHSWWIMMN